MKETALSQLFLAFNLAKLQPAEESARVADAIVDSLLASGASVRYPGQQVLKTRAEKPRPRPSCSQRAVDRPAPSLKFRHPALS